MPLQPFHLAVPVNDLDEARNFYGGVLGCAEGRSADSWVDFDFFGHQLVCHLSRSSAQDENADNANAVDGHAVPVPHFGVVLQWDVWEALAAKLQTAGLEFIIEPTVRFVGRPGEQATLFLRDPSGNALEFKAMRDDSKLFAR